MITNKNLIFDFVDKKDLKVIMLALYNSLLNKNIYSKELHSDKNNEFSDFIISTLENDQIRLIFKYKKSITGKKSINTKMISDLYEFFKEFFVYLYIDSEPFNSDDGLNLNISFKINTQQNNFKYENIKNNIEYVCAYELNNLRNK